MKKLAIAAAALAVAGSAQAADLYVKGPAPAPVYDWSGIYVGANAGGGWADAEWRGTIGGGAVDFSTQPKGALAGGQVGINKQYGHWVLGTEVTGDWSDLRESTGPVSLGGSASLTATTKLRELETLTTRFGYAMNNWLFYAKSGGATGVVGVSSLSATGAAFAQSQRLFGGTSGAGIEYGLTPNIILGVEYDFTRLFPGQFTGVDSFGNLASVGAVHSFDVQSVVGRVNYKF
jgi:outer membrane immunogenic protein